MVKSKVRFFCSLFAVKNVNCNNTRFDKLYNCSFFHYVNGLNSKIPVIWLFPEVLISLSKQESELLSDLIMKCCSRCLVMVIY